MTLVGTMPASLYPQAVHHTPLSLKWLGETSGRGRKPLPVVSATDTLPLKCSQLRAGACQAALPLSSSEARVCGGAHQHSLGRWEVLVASVLNWVGPRSGHCPPCWSSGGYATSLMPPPPPALPPLLHQCTPLLSLHPDINECEEEDIECEPRQMCFNTRGSYQCVDTPCPANYRQGSSPG